MPENTHIVIKEGTLGITEKAFYGSYGLISVTIPNSMKHIGENAFTSCNALKDVYCYAPDPPIACYYLYEDRYILAFDLGNFITLHVPAGSLETYRTTFPWRNFKEIVAILNN